MKCWFCDDSGSCEYCLAMARLEAKDWACDVEREEALRKWLFLTAQRNDYHDSGADLFVAIRKCTVDIQGFAFVCGDDTLVLVYSDGMTVTEEEPGDRGDEVFVDREEATVLVKSIKKVWPDMFSGEPS